MKPRSRYRLRVVAFAIIGMALFVGGIWVIAAGVLENERNIAKRPTTEELLRILADVREDQRRACRVVNARLAVIGKIIEAQRPSAATTAYYADHPDELARAQRFFDKTLRAFKPRNCLKAYPVPTLEEVKDVATGDTALVMRGGDAAPGQDKSKQPP